MREARSNKALRAIGRTCIVTTSRFAKLSRKALQQLARQSAAPRQSVPSIEGSNAAQTPVRARRNEHVGRERQAVRVSCMQHIVQRMCKATSKVGYAEALAH